MNESRPKSYLFKIRWLRDIYHRKETDNTFSREEKLFDFRNKYHDTDD